ncbi:hypothetical protein K449DRAFT_106521 [Hypoxylon sp. EC38]|nr:hypothetical protein K449DRAFT_106521 [Hypoxylon sp. EC38]
MIHYHTTSSPIQETNTTNYCTDRGRMDVRTSRPVDRPFAMPGGFPTYAERPRELSRPPTSTRDSETETSPSRTATSQTTTPLRGILKNAPTPLTTALMQRPQDPLAARFSRAPRPEPQRYPVSAPQSPTYPSDSERYSSFDTDSQSAASDLSINTQATSVVSDVSSVPPKPSKPSTQVKHVRHVPIPTTNRVRTRRGSKTPSEITKPPVPEKKRTVHIQFVPSTQNSSQTQSQPQPQSQALQLARKSDKDLLYKIDQLESEADSLRKERSRLNRDLDDASVQLSSKEMISRSNSERRGMTSRNSLRLLRTTLSSS